jgi:hypothetical protein
VAWLRAGDNAATYPALLAAAGHVPGDDRIVNELAGFVHRLAEQSAGHLTDGRVDMGTAALIGGSRVQVLLDLAVACGLMTRTGRGRTASWVLVEDPEFLHIRARKEIEWDRQQRRDTGSVTLTVPVRHRDGDACRYCGVAVNWGDRKGARGGTYDHRGDVRTPGTVDTLVVACKACNSGRRDRPNRDELYPLRPVPTRPLYGPRTVDWLARHGITVPLAVELVDDTGVDPGAPRTQSRPADITTPPESCSAHQPGGGRTFAGSRPGIQPGIESSGARPGIQPGIAGGPPQFEATSLDLTSASRPSRDIDAGHSPADLQISADSQDAARDGPGRDGPGRVPAPREGPGGDGARRGPRRGARRRRGDP